MAPFLFPHASPLWQKAYLPSLSLICITNERNFLYTALVPLSISHVESMPHLHVNKKYFYALQCIEVAMESQKK